MGALALEVQRPEVRRAQVARQGRAEQQERAELRARAEPRARVESRVRQVQPGKAAQQEPEAPVRLATTC